MKKLIEGNELLFQVPSNTSPGVQPIVRLQNGLVLDEKNCWSQPTLILGNMGSGKTTMIHRFMDSILEHADRCGDNVVIFCAKPDMLRYARPGDPVISINSKDPASQWNLFREIKNAPDPEMASREIANDLFAESREKTMQIFFPMAASDLFHATTMHLLEYSEQTGTPVSNSDLKEFIISTPVRGDEEVPGWIDLSERFPRFYMARDYIGDGSDQGRGCLSEIHMILNSVLIGSFAAEGGTFSAAGALKNGGARIFLYHDYANAGHSTLTVLHILLDMLMKQGMSQDAQHKTWFFMDEGSLLPKSNVLTDALSFGRDPGGNGKGGVRIVMALQSAKLMTRQYSQQEAEVLLSLFPNIISLRVADGMSRRVVSDRYGKARFQYSYAGIGDRIHYIDALEDVVSDYHFSKITKEGQAIISIPGISEHPFFYDGYIKTASEIRRELL